MRLGYSPAAARRAPEVVATAAAAEDLGLDEVWLSEDYLERGGFTLASAVAACTERIAVGIGVVNPWTRHPALIAMEFAALDEVARGRAVLGLGSSNRHWMSDLLGLPFRTPLAQLREAVDIIRPLLRGERVDHSGEHFEVHAQLSFRPERTDHRLVLGVKGERALAIVPEVADGALLPVLASPPYVRWAREASGGAPVSGYVLFSCDDDRAAVRNAARRTLAQYLGLHGAHAVTTMAGLDPELADLFRTRMIAGDPATELVTDELLDVFAVVGDLEDCTSGLRALADAGLDAAVITDEESAHPQQVLTSLIESARIAEIWSAPRPCE